MQTLDLRKIDYKNYTKLDFEEDNKRWLEQDIIRAYDFLQKTHILENDDKALLRVLNTRKNEYDEYCKKSDEYILSDFESFKKFILKYKKSDKRIFDIFYNVFNYDRYKMKESLKYGSKFLGTKANASNTSILIADFDGVTYEEYLNTIKPQFFNRGIETIDIWSGHGIHTIILLDKNCDDAKVFEKWIITLQSNNLEPDIACKDAARIMRLPFFNNTKAKYEMMTRAEIITDTNKRYNLKEVFSKFGQDYENIDIEEEITKLPRKTRKTLSNQVFDVNLLNIEDLEKYYDIDVKVFPEGVQNMLKGLVKGYSNLQVMFLTVYFKKFFEKEQIIDILTKLEAINGNTWNTWNIEDEVERFYEYTGISRFDFLELQQIFGRMEIEKENEVKITQDLFQYSAKEIQLYLGFKRAGIASCKGFELQQLSGLKQSTVYTVVGNLIQKRGHFYLLNEEKLNKDENGYVILDREKMANLVFGDADITKVYLYLKFRQQNQTSVHIKKESIAEALGYSRQSISKYLKKLEEKRLIKIERGHYLKDTEKRISDTYIVY